MYVASIQLCVRMSHVYAISHHGAASADELDFFTSRQNFCSNIVLLL